MTARTLALRVVAWCLDRRAAQRPAPLRCDAPGESRLDLLRALLARPWPEAVDRRRRFSTIISRLTHGPDAPDA